jgi:hypothetical protein
MVGVFGKPVIVRGYPEHHRSRGWIMSVVGDRPHFLASHTPVRCALEDLSRVYDSFTFHGVPFGPPTVAITRYYAPPPTKVDRCTAALCATGVAFIATRNSDEGRRRRPNPRHDDKTRGAGTRAAGFTFGQRAIYPAKSAR